MMVKKLSFFFKFSIYPNRLKILTYLTDESMELLYSNGKGNVFVDMVNWLSCNVEELQVTGVLAVGNFARAGMHQIQMNFGIKFKFL